MVPFATLWSNYPTEPKRELFERVLGGGWPALVGNPNYDNTCTIRLSVAFNRCGIKVSEAFGKKDGNHKDKNGDFIAIKVPTGEEMVTSFYGAQTWGMSREPGTPIDLKDVPAWTGILVYRVAGSTANGHIDLWDKTSCRIDCYSLYAKASFAIALWKVD
ncbi:T6SS effector amidase Tae4 family protein [Mesorhizobium sp.]|uniref:T6SS effector amidase Tae4 family protein n=1 Tax=Mesorhizobium sp. TaxID=1871066 RepID=UPI0011F99512|nr:T6SS effector amidase Tae4 family protein [Mesorhizobium sp.]TIM05502.1 MAG: hypothetical protein E5Y62_27310 [Mesorhizobium sp.]